MSAQTQYTDEEIKRRAKEVADKRMPKDWDRKSLTMVNVFNAYFIEALIIEYNQVIRDAHAKGYLSAATGKESLSGSLKTFFEDF